MRKVAVVILYVLLTSVLCLPFLLLAVPLIAVNYCYEELFGGFKSDPWICPIVNTYTKFFRWLGGE